MAGRGGGRCLGPAATSWPSVRARTGDGARLAVPPARRPSVTEVPEHLLKRSRDRRAALGLGGGDGGDAGGGGDAAPAASGDAGTSVEPAAAAARPAAVAPVEAAVVPPKPVPSYVRASLERKKIPLWVMPVLAFLPLWAIMYVNTLSKPRSTVPDPARRRRHRLRRPLPELPPGRRLRRRRSSALRGGRRRRHPHDLPLHRRPAAVRLARQRRHRCRGHAVRQPGQARRPAQDAELQRQPDAHLQGHHHPDRAARDRAPRA